VFAAWVIPVAKLINAKARASRRQSEAFVCGRQEIREAFIYSETVCFQNPFRHRRFCIFAFQARLPANSSQSCFDFRILWNAKNALFDTV
jgi:hypothetical protein